MTTALIGNILLTVLWIIHTLTRSIPKHDEVYPAWSVELRKDNTGEDIT